MTAVVKTTPRFAKNIRSFSKARLTRLRAVASFSFNAAATSCGVRFSKKRRTMALRSGSPSRPMASSSNGEI
jgi:hypothetical protein